MTKNIFILVLFVLFASCTNSQTKNITNDSKEAIDAIDYSKEIQGCWKMVDRIYIIESNYHLIDSIIEATDRKNVANEIFNPTIIKFTNNSGKYYRNGSKSGENSFYYEIKNDSLCYKSKIRSDDELKSKITIENDTIHLVANAIDDFQSFIIEIQDEVNIPTDIKCKKMIRNVIFVRVPDCDQYEE
ncbi:MAG: hypothetical protein LBT43_01365 [Prevotella sp.]|jgi:hypothetical protein|nr:hypothetical protein [Prevotella sp.]